MSFTTTVVGGTEKESDNFYSEHNIKARPQHPLDLIRSIPHLQVPLQMSASNMSHTIFASITLWWQRFVPWNCGQKRMAKGLPHFRDHFVSTRLHRVAFWKWCLYPQRSCREFPLGLSLQFKGVAASEKQEEWGISINSACLWSLLSWRTVRSRCQLVLPEVPHPFWDNAAAFWCSASI